MDTWCALWFWPLDKWSDLPSREAWLASARLLAGETPPAENTWPLFNARLGFDVSALLAASSHELPDSEALSAAVGWYADAREVLKDQVFHHWELAFPEVLGPVDGVGFDLILGNPPWRKATWNDAAT